VIIFQPDEDSRQSRTKRCGLDAAEGPRPVSNHLKCNSLIPRRGASMRFNFKQRLADFAASAFRKDRPGLTSKILRRIIGMAWPDGFTAAFFSFNRNRPAPWKGRAAGLTLSFDCDHDTDYQAMPELLDALEREGLNASFACIAKWIERDPGIHREMIRRGHELINHTYTHPSNSHFHPDERFNEITRDDRRREIETADRVIRNLLAVHPTGFRTPHFGDSHTADVYEILAELGYRYSSSKIAIQCPSFGMPYRESQGIWEFPLSFDPKRINTCFDTYNRFKKSSGTVTAGREKEFFGGIEKVIRRAMESGSYVNLYFDPSDIRLLSQFRDFLRLLGSLKERVWIAPYGRILEEWSPPAG
jgi:peptidoglycan-N-acetylglucosamine deacetylase